MYCHGMVVSALPWVVSTGLPLSSGLVDVFDAVAHQPIFLAAERRRDPIQHAQQLFDAVGLAFFSTL